MRIAIVANTGWYLHNFRLNLAHALLARGHQVVLIGDNDAYGQRILDAGFAYCSAPFTGAGTRLDLEWRCVRSLRRTLREQDADLVLSYTPKGNVYSALAIAGLKPRQIANVSGLGRAFVRRTLLSRLMLLIYRAAFARAEWVFFQNREDQLTFLELGLVRRERSDRLPGSGVDLGRFVPTTLPGDADRACFLFVGRLLRAKGVGTFIEAAREVRQTHPGCRFRLLGPMAPRSADSIAAEEIETWQREGLIEYLGTTDDVRPVLAEADCVVLPSVYREGVPRSLLEGAACGRPIITTDAPGCRDTIDDDISGLLCRPGDAADLAHQMRRFLRLTPSERSRMGRLGREKMEREFDESLVISAYEQRIAALAESSGRSTGS